MKTYWRFLLKFINSYQHAGNEIAAFLRLNDKVSASALTHKLNGVSGNLALTHVEKIVRQLDDLFHRGEDGLSIELAKSLQNAIDVVREVVVQREAANPKLTDQLQPVTDDSASQENLLLILEQFLVALDHDDPDKSEPYLLQLQGRIADIEFNLLREQLGEFAFRKAEETTQNLIKQLKLIS